ncbi:MAG: hypothetical protein J6Y94_03385, partial [Bacteriovoracaceae bacterium]|nr:hypothetical protein [Bacteriovoracaceae bacterium]
QLMQQRFQMMPNFTTRYLTFGYLFSNMLRGYLGPSNTDQYEFAARRDHGPYMATSFSLGGGVFKLGASVAYLNRREAEGAVDPNTPIDVHNYYAKGKAIIFTGGAKFTLPIAWLPTLAVTWHNIGGNKFSGQQGVPINNILETIDLGFGITPLLSNESRLHLEVNYKDIRRKYDALSSHRRWLVGAEFDVFRLIYLRLGYGDGYFSGGLGIRAKRLALDLTVYQVNTQLAQQEDFSDRRMALEVSTWL